MVKYTDGSKKEAKSKFLKTPEVLLATKDEKLKYRKEYVATHAKT
jgi:hypothetical protein